MTKFKKIAFIFPGQGAQYPGMGKDFYDSYSEAKEVFQQGDDVLGRNLSSIIFNGPDTLLTETRNSQLGIYVVSLAILKTLHKLFPTLKPAVCAGLSLGEYTALTAAGKLPYDGGLRLVDKRAQFMNDACEATAGTMAVVLGLDADAVEQLVAEVAMPNDLWAANFNCPGQVVISGTTRGIEAGTEAAKAKGAKRVLPLQVHGAFHSGLMSSAQNALAPYIDQAPLLSTTCAVIMNVTGKEAADVEEIKSNLKAQVTHPVRWEQSIRTMVANDADLYVEIGCGKTLAGFNKRIGVVAPCVSIEKTSDLAALETLLKGGGA
jgi:[acyl-carrier-protein] S-malonyltransferase